MMNIIHLFFGLFYCYYEYDIPPNVQSIIFFINYNLYNKYNKHKLFYKNKLGYKKGISDIAFL